MKFKRQETKNSLLTYIETSKSFTNFFILKVFFNFFFDLKKKLNYQIYLFFLKKKKLQYYNISSIYGIFNRIRIKKTISNERFLCFFAKNFIKKKKLKNLLFLFNTHFLNLQKLFIKFYNFTKIRIDVKGMGYNIKFFRKKRKLIFKIGYSKKKIFFLPFDIFLLEYHKYYISLGSIYKTKLINTCIQIQNIRKPHTYKILGLYFNRIYPKPKAIIKKK